MTKTSAAPPAKSAAAAKPAAKTTSAAGLRQRLSELQDRASRLANDADRHESQRRTLLLDDTALAPPQRLEIYLFSRERWGGPRMVHAMAQA